MPSKLDDASNLRFLYACLQTCDFPAIDYHKVAKQFGIQAPAARMRLRRLRDSLEGKEGGSNASKKQMGGGGGRRPRGGKKAHAKEGYEKYWQGVDDGDDGDDDDEEDVPLGSLKFRRRGSGDGLKKEESADWKMLPESSPVFSTAVQEARMYDPSAFASADAKMPPMAPSVRQMSLQVLPQMPQMRMYNMAEPYMYSSPHVALPRTPYYQTSFSDYHPDQQQQQPQLEAVASPDSIPDSKQPLLVEETSGEHFGDLQ